MGVAYQSWFSPKVLPPITYPFVARTDLPFFHGTGYEVGDRVGDIVGYEWDNTDPEGDGRRLWDPEKSRIPQIDPASLQVLMTGKAVDVDGREGTAEAVYFVSRAGARVFSLVRQRSAGRSALRTRFRAGTLQAHQPRSLRVFPGAFRIGLFAIPGTTAADGRSGRGRGGWRAGRLRRASGGRRSAGGGRCGGSRPGRRRRSWR